MALELSSLFAVDSDILRFMIFEMVSICSRFRCTETSVTEVKHRPLRIVLGWGTEVVD